VVSLIPHTLTGHVLSLAQTWGFFVKDQLKKLLLSSVLTTLISAGLIAIIKWGGQYFYIYAWLFVFMVSLVRAHQDQSVCRGIRT